MFGRSGNGGLAGVALIDEGKFDTVAGGGLNVAGELVDGRAIADIGGRDMLRETMAERIDGQMQSAEFEMRSRPVR